MPSFTVLTHGSPEVGTSGVRGSAPSDTPDRALNGSDLDRVGVAGNVSDTLLIKKVSPVYPQIARLARVQGLVVLHAQINKDGTIEKLELVSGHPLLVSAAIEAVKQWIYTPYLLGGKAVKVDTEVVVNFSLSP
jgi:protein TonB